MVSRKSTQLSKSSRKKSFEIESPRSSNKTKKPFLAFGYGYDPEQLRDGIKKYEYSHTLEDGRKLYTFEPPISYRIFGELSKMMEYQWALGFFLVKGETEISNWGFVTDRPPEQVIKELNRGIKKIFKKYDPAPVIR